MFPVIFSMTTSHDGITSSIFFLCSASDTTSRSEANTCFSHENLPALLSNVTLLKKNQKSQFKYFVDVPFATKHDSLIRALIRISKDITDCFLNINFTDQSGQKVPAKCA